MAGKPPGLGQKGISMAHWWWRDNFLMKVRRSSQQLLITQILFIIYVAKYKNLHNKMLKNRPNIPVHCGQQWAQHHKSALTNEWHSGIVWTSHIWCGKFSQNGPCLVWERPIESIFTILYYIIHKNTQIQTVETRWWNLVYSPVDTLLFWLMPAPQAKNVS